MSLEHCNIDTGALQLAAGVDLDEALKMMHAAGSWRGWIAKVEMRVSKSGLKSCCFLSGYKAERYSSSLKLWNWLVSKSSYCEHFYLRTFCLIFILVIVLTSMYSSCQFNILQSMKPFSHFHLQKSNWFLTQYFSYFL